MTVLGLTGSFGSGKSAVARLLREMGIPVIDADQAARDVVAAGTEGFGGVIAEFGEDMVAEDGELDRKKLADVVFEDESARQRLNRIVHPLVGAEIGRFLAAHAAEDLCVLEIPLLLESPNPAPVEKIVVVTTSEQNRIDRLAGRGFNPSEIEARLRTQMPQEEKVRRADYVIDNDGDLAATRRQVEELVESLRRSACEAS